MKNAILGNTIENVNLKSEDIRFLLEIGLWVNAFSDDNRHLIIAEALNKTVCDKKIKIKGYLITNWRVYLILDCDFVQAELFVIHFQKLIRFYLIQLETDEFIPIQFDQQLFQAFPFYDYVLANLLLGKKSENPNVDLNLSYYKDFLEGYNFCSVQFHKGRIGPVIVNAVSP